MPQMLWWIEGLSMNSAAIHPYSRFGVTLASSQVLQKHHLASAVQPPFETTGEDRTMVKWNAPQLLGSRHAARFGRATLALQGLSSDLISRGKDSLTCV
jgi:hypothetical protein